MVTNFFNILLETFKKKKPCTIRIPWEWFATYMFLQYTRTIAHCNCDLKIYKQVAINRAVKYYK